VDPRTRRVTVSGTEVALTPKEFDIIECLAADPGRVVTRQELLERAWDANWYGPTKVLDVHVAALRRKLGVDGLVETVYGRGFRLGRLGALAPESVERSDAAEPQPQPQPQSQSQSPIAEG
jgi:DNA-binding response OmpR family regulator